MLRYWCLLLKLALEKEGNPSMALLFLVKISPWRHGLGVLLRIVKGLPLKAFLLLTVEEKVYKHQCCTSLSSTFVRVMLQTWEKIVL